MKNTILNYLGIGAEYNRNKTVRDAYINANIRSDGMCMFLNEKENICSIYSVRPVVCRNYGMTKQGSIVPCEPMEYTNFDTEKLLDENDYEFVDIVTNRIKITGKKREKMVMPETLNVWFNRLQNGILDSEKMRSLLKSSIDSNVDYFIETLVR
ncbi:MAG: YkgJ family cysteine cluster protein [Defluviitaleaceae bacterium]|nr:YkgJ family cysteine cluster protein [Defluviitaleaceae bacterium]